LGSFDTGLQVKENNLNTEMDFWRRTARTSRILKVRNYVINKKMG